MRRVNLPFFLGVFAAILAIVLGVAGLHRWQIRRNADVFAENANELLAEGKPIEASEQLGKYLQFRPRDHERRAQYARLLNDIARKPGQSGGFVRLAIIETETALRGVPGSNSGTLPGTLSVCRRQTATVRPKENSRIPRNCEGYGCTDTPTGSRTPVFELRTRRPGPLDDGGVRTCELLAAEPRVSSRRFCREGLFPAAKPSRVFIDGPGTGA